MESYNKHIKSSTTHNIRSNEELLKEFKKKISTLSKNIYERLQKGNSWTQMIALRDTMKKVFTILGDIYGPEDWGETKDLGKFIDDYVQIFLIGYASLFDIQLPEHLTINDYNHEIVEHFLYFCMPKGNKKKVANMIYNYICLLGDGQKEKLNILLGILSLDYFRNYEGFSSMMRENWAF
jgi:hypothetical protein